MSRTTLQADLREARGAALFAAHHGQAAERSAAGSCCTHSNVFLPSEIRDASADVRPWASLPFAVPHADARASATRKGYLPFYTRLYRIPQTYFRANILGAAADCTVSVVIDSYRCPSS